jgi:Zn-dependent protease
VHPLFWLGTILLGWGVTRGQDGLTAVGYLLLWVACVFISILLHELGHVWMGRAFGARGHIVLWGLGGLAVGSSTQRERWQRILVYAAGPGIQFILFGAVWAIIHWGLPHIAERVSVEWFSRIILFLAMLYTINLYWPLLNLLPIWPLDGGRISRELCEAGSPRNGTLTSLYISAAVAGLLAIHCFMAMDGRGFPFLQEYFGGDQFMAIFFAVFCIASIQAIQQERERHRPWDDDAPWR